MQDRSIRSLVRLQSSGSTSRLLNLLRLHHLNGQSEEHVANPLFQIPALNKAIIVKHRVRRHEQEQFDTHRANATKLILALDSEDLRSGGRFAFVGQRGWDQVLSAFSNDPQHISRDRRTLELLDSLPSFDPFLLREYLRRADLTPASTYFDISPADTQQMVEYLRKELQPLVRLTGSEGSIGPATAAIVQKLMSPTAHEELELLGKTLRLTPEQYGEGLFCWKGFLYYKWRLEAQSESLPKLADRIRAVRIVGAADRDEKLFVAESKAAIDTALKTTFTAAADLLKVYDNAFKLMVLAEDPTAFRDFLLDAPSLFVKLGDLIGVIDHIDGFWNFRFPPNKSASARGDELAEIFQDFIESLGEPEPPAGAPAGVHVELA